MAEGSFPYIPQDLLEALDKAFPERSPLGPNEHLPELMWLGGKREVVRFLRARFQDQQSKSEIPNVLVR